MAISNSTQNPFCVFLTIFISFLFLNIHNVKSGTFSFNFPTFEQGAQNLGFVRDTSVSSGVLQLTKKNNLGQPQLHSVGLAAYFGYVHLYNKTRGTFNFTTEFSFVVEGSSLHGDGMTFFLASPDFDFPSTSSGGFLGLFSPVSAFTEFNKKIVAVEFDSFSNEWESNPESESSHVGIDVNSIRSVATVPWSFNEANGKVGKARINYDSESLELSVSLTYPNIRGAVTGGVSLRHAIDLKRVLPEWVFIGFSAATGELVETHDILSWSFSSTS